MLFNKRLLGRILKFHGQEVGLDYAWGRKLQEDSWLPYFEVVDVGKISVPISEQDLAKLKSVARQSPTIEGFKPNARWEWQIDGSQLNLPEDFINISLPKLIIRATRQLGFDSEGLDIEAKLQHLYLYPQGGHYKRHRTKEKEFGAFAILSLQIPVDEGHEGGEFKVWLKEQIKSFSSSVDSTSKSYLNIFYDDCEHELSPVTRGCRSVLVFHLVLNNWVDFSSSIVDHPICVKIYEEIREVLSFWNGIDVDKCSDLLAIPLDHFYGKELSFRNLKGKDRLIASLLRSVDFVEVHLAVVTKCITGLPNYEHEDYRTLSTEMNVKSNPNNDQSYSDADCYQTQEWNSFKDVEVPRNGNEDDSCWKTKTVDFQFVMELVGYLDYIERNRESIFLDMRKMVCEEQPIYLTDHWVDESDTLVSYQGLNIRVTKDCHSELVGVEDEVFEPNRPDEEFFKWNGQRQAVVEFKYHQSVLVLWPRGSSFNMLCRSGIDNALKHLERGRKQKSAATREESLRKVRHLLWYCCNYPLDVWWVDETWKSSVRGKRPSRIISVCLDLEAEKEAIELLSLLKIPFELNGPRFYEAVCSDQVATGIASLVALVGWEFAEDAVSQLIAAAGVEKSQQIGFSASMSIGLFDLCSTEAAFTVGNLTCSLLAEIDLNWLAAMNLQSLVSYAAMVMRLEETRHTSNPTRIFSLSEKVRFLDVWHLPQMILQLFKYDPLLVKRKSSCRYLYTVMCQNFISKADLEDKTIVAQLPTLAPCYFWLEDSALLRSYIDHICRASEISERTILDPVMSSREIWEVSITCNVQDALNRLVEARINELSRIERPTFTWEQPDASIPDHPDVEAFLRSNKPRMNYSRFSSVVKARKFATKYFPSASPLNGYSATTRIGGRGETAFCEITKTREVFNASLRQYNAYQKELKKLRAKRPPISNMICSSNPPASAMVSSLAKSTKKSD